MDGVSTFSEGVFVPDVEENIPLPITIAEAFPPLTPQQELDTRARTIKFLADLTQIPITPSQDNQDAAERLAHEMVSNPGMNPDFSSYPNETLAYLAGMVSQMNHMIVQELADLKVYVINKLVYIAEHTEKDKERLTALRNLGEISGVDAFMKRSEVTVNIKPIQEVENELKQMLDALEGTAIEIKERIEYEPNLITSSVPDAP